VFNVYVLTLRQLASIRRLLIMAALAAAPALIAWAMLAGKEAPLMVEFEKVSLNAMLVGAIAPLVVLAIAGATFAHDIEDRTIANLILAPIPRWKIVVPKLLATITLAAPFMVASASITSYYAFLGDMRAVFAVTASVLLCVALYSSFFVWLGLMHTQAIGIGLLYVVLWEGFLTTYVSGIRLLSIRHYSTSFMHGLDPRRFAWNVEMKMTSVSVVAAVVFFGFLALTIRKLKRMDIP
jgi:ABC-2 type transport system permease protein